MVYFEGYNTIIFNNKRGLILDTNFDDNILRI
jgi:hypothetical protein